MIAAATTLIALAAIGFGANEFRRRTSGGEPEPVSFIVTPSGDERINPNSVAISQDGRRLVYVGLDKSSSHLYVRNLADINTRSVPGTERADDPFFSPDGKWLAFFASGELKRIPVDGGSSLTIAANVVPRASLWATGNRIIISTQAVTRHRSGLSAVLLSGGVVKPIILADTIHGENLTYPISLADGKTILFESFGPRGTEDDKLAVASLGTPGLRGARFPGSEAAGISRRIHNLPPLGWRSRDDCRPAGGFARAEDHRRPDRAAGQGLFRLRRRTFAKRHACFCYRWNNCATGR